MPNEVSINVTGRDSGAGSLLDSLREKAERLGVSTDRLNDPSQKASERKDFGEEMVAREREAVRQSLEKERRELIERFNRERAELKNKLDQDILDAPVSEFTNLSRQKDYELNKLGREQRTELGEFDERSDTVIERELIELKDALDKLTETIQNQDKDQRIERQRDDDEFENTEKRRGGGMGGAFVNVEDDDDDVSGGNGGSRRGSGGGGSGSGGNSNGENGEDGEEGKGGSKAKALLARYAAPAAALALAYKMLNGGDQLAEVSGRLNAIRGATGMSGMEGHYAVRDQFTSHAYGLWATKTSQEDYMDYSLKLAKTSGVSRDLGQRAAQGIFTEKGYGLDNGFLNQMSTFERMDKSQSTTAEASIRLLETMIQIEKSGIKRNDFTQFQEKLTTQNRLLAEQINKREGVSTGQATQTMAAFASLGGSGADFRAADFVGGVDQGLTNPANERIKVLLYDTIAKMYPELSGSQAGIERKRRQGMNDPKVAVDFIKRIKSISASDDEMYFNMDAVFGSLTDDQRQMLSNNIGGEFGDILLGKKTFGTDTPKSLNTARQNAYDNTGAWGSGKVVISDIGALAGDAFAKAVSEGLNRSTAFRNSMNTTVNKNVIKK
jgi:hypothetical protein